MKANQVTDTYTEYQSETHPVIAGTGDRAKKATEFLDAHPIAFDIVIDEQSKAFGFGSCVYIGWAQRSQAVSAVIERLARFADEVSGKQPGSHRGTIFNFKARFTLEHYRDEGFTGGVFQCHDRFPRGCMTLDYTIDTLPEVVKRFFDWAGNDGIKKVTIDGCEVLPELWKV
jgi:hypothetical protein